MEFARLALTDAAGIAVATDADGKVVATELAAASPSGRAAEFTSSDRTAAGTSSFAAALCAEASVAPKPSVNRLAATDALRPPKNFNNSASL